MPQNDLAVISAGHSALSEVPLADRLGARVVFFLKHERLGEIWTAIRVDFVESKCDRERHHQGRSKKTSSSVVHKLVGSSLSLSHLGLNNLLTITTIQEIT